ncbi:MAG: S1C family serine protease [Acidobacteria bacterium]|nr:S1C family serine protease [Acidobacteriota bacterium]
MNSRVPLKPTMVPTANILQRTFLVKDKSIGTAFTIDRDGRQYLVTARHVSEGSSGGIDLFHDGQWKRLSVAVVGVGKSGEDVAVLRPDTQLAHKALTLEIGNRGYALGQQVMFFGFPFGWQYGDCGGANHGYPLPFVKAGIVSQLTSPGGARRLFVDAHGNKGFSGGPLVAEIAGNMSAIGVVVIAVPNPPDVETIDEHAGFVAVEPIHVVTEIVDDNPVGFQLNHSS